MDKIKAGIIGATGYAGAELVRLLSRHPHVQVAAVSSVSFEGKKLSEVYPSLYGVCDMTLTSGEGMERECDVIFASLPHGLSEEWADKCVKAGVKFIDLGADFRLDSAEEYAKWYGKEYKLPALHLQSVYCIPELHRAALKGASIVGNPGCYPTSVALALAPLMKADMAGGIVVDSKSGVTGSGRGLSDTTHYPNCNEAFSPYKVASHRHTPEIEQTLSKLAGHRVKITFVPHLLPLNRGIISTCYADLKKPASARELFDMYNEFYAGEKFVRIMPLGACANLRNVRMSNYCDISVHADEHTGRAVIVAAIDNMVKGAAGQAIQNMNILFDLDEGEGLDYIPPAF